MSDSLKMGLILLLIAIGALIIATIENMTGGLITVVLLGIAIYQIFSKK